MSLSEEFVEYRICNVNHYAEQFIKTTERRHCPKKDLYCGFGT
jgi:hypothetical protein